MYQLIYIDFSLPRSTDHHRSDCVRIFIDVMYRGAVRDNVSKLQTCDRLKFGRDVEFGMPEQGSAAVTRKRTFRFAPFAAALLPSNAAPKRTYDPTTNGQPWKAGCKRGAERALKLHWVSVQFGTAARHVPSTL